MNLPAYNKNSSKAHFAYVWINFNVGEHIFNIRVNTYTITIYECVQVKSMYNSSVTLTYIHTCTQNNFPWCWLIVFGILLLYFIKAIPHIMMMMSVLEIKMDIDKNVTRAENFFDKIFFYGVFVWMSWFCLANN